MKNVLCILIISAITCWPTVLGDLAASLQPGQWAELNSTGFGKSLLDAGGGHHILEYTEDAKWDPVTKQFLCIGQGHYAELKFITYDDATNKWTHQPKPSWASGIGHGYDHSGIDVAGGYFFYRPYGRRSVHKYDISAKSWTALPEIPSSVMSYNNCCMGMEFFPELGAGGLIVVGNGNVHFYNKSTNLWSKMASGLAMSTQYQYFTEYNPVHKVAVFGGGNGSSDIHKLESSGKVTTLKNAPVGAGVMQTVFTCDPVSGKYLVFHKSEKFYEYDVTADTWKDLGSRGAPLFSANYGSGIFGIVGAPVSTYGVNMFLAWNWENSKVMIYKHSAGSPVHAGRMDRAIPDDFISVLPNPFTASVQIKLPASAYAAIYNLKGQLISRINNNSGNPITWNADHNTPGIYLLKGHIGKNRFSRKLILEK
jgi:hypothetical protein